MANLDGVYSIVVSSDIITSTGVIAVDNGDVFGNDNLGSTFEGRVELVADGSRFQFAVVMTTPPDSFLVATGNALEGQFQLRAIDLEIPVTDMSTGKPNKNHSHDMVVIFRRLPQEYILLARAGGRLLQIRVIEAADLAWQARDVD